MVLRRTSRRPVFLRGGERKELSEFRETIDDAEPYFITDLHLDHFRREARAHPLGILQPELHLSSAAFNKMEQEHRRQALKLVVGGMLAHVEDLRHAGSPFCLRRSHPYG